MEMESITATGNVVVHPPRDYFQSGLKIIKTIACVATVSRGDGHFGRPTLTRDSRVTSTQLM